MTASDVASLNEFPDVCEVSWTLQLLLPPRTNSLTRSVSKQRYCDIRCNKGLDYDHV